MVKNVRVQKHVTEYLRKGEKSTSEIIDYINKKLKHGTDYHSMCNVLGKSGLYVQTGTIKRENASSRSRYKIATWRLK